MNRLDKVLGGRGVGSRQEIKRLCKMGRIEVAGEVVRDASMKVSDEHELRVDGELIEEIPIFAMYHKPAGVHSTMEDNWGRPGLGTVLPERWRDAMHPVGRLDAETTGLLMFSREGSLTQRLLHPKRAIEREYVARVEHQVDEERLREVLAGGVETSEGVFSAVLKEVSDDTVRVIVVEGKHRMVRRILANAGHPVLELHRTRYGAFELGELGEGEVRACPPDEYTWLMV